MCTVWWPVRFPPEGIPCLDSVAVGINRGAKVRILRIVTMTLYVNRTMGDAL